MTILIVEDDRPLNDGIALSLGGAKTLQAYNLKEARVLLKEAIDLILLDVNLPDGSGLDFCKEIRSFSKERTIISPSPFLWRCSGRGSMPLCGGMGLRLVCMSRRDFSLILII